MGTKLTVTKEQIAENMNNVDVRTAEEYGNIVTDVTVTMKNGFTLHVGTASAPEYYNEEEDKEYCLKNIKNKIRLILEYELQDKIFKKNRDWSTFKVPKKHKEFEPFEKVLRVDDMPVQNPYPWIKVWSCDFYNFYDKDTHTHYFVSGYAAKDDEVIPYTGNEDKLGKIVEKRR